MWSSCRDELGRYPAGRRGEPEAAVVGTRRPSSPRLRAKAADDQALIAHLRLQIEKLKRDKYGPRSERSSRLLDQLELQLEDLEASATEDELAAEQAAAKTTQVAAFTRKRPARKPFPEHLPRERRVVPGPTGCPCCGGTRLSKLGEDITETLEVIPRQWKVIEHVREKFSCRQCESIAQAPAPFHVVPRGWAGPSLLAMILFEKYGQHQPLNRQAERYAREGVPLSLSTLADQVGTCCSVLWPLYQRQRSHMSGGQPITRRRHDGAGPGQGQDRDGAMLGLCAGRSAVRWLGAASSALLSTRVTARASIHSSIWQAGAVCCRPMPIAAMASCMTSNDRLG